MSSEFDILRPFFDGQYYRNTYPDVPGNFGSAWEHFKEIGIPEHRSPSSGYDATYYLTQNIDSFTGTSQRDLIMGLEGSDRISGLNRRDRIYGGDGNDTLKGNNGSDRLYGNSGKDKLVGNYGNDRLYGNSGRDTLNGSSGKDTLTGGGGNDLLRGGNGNDKLVGNSGNDRLYGDRGRDTLTGGGGKDEFFLGKNAGGATVGRADVIKDFTKGKDLIHLTDGLTFDDLEISQGTGNKAGDTIIREELTGEYLAVLQGVNSNTIDIDDFTGFVKVLPSVPAVISDNTVTFSPTDNQEAIAAKNPASITIDTQTIYIGTWQQSANNQNPIIASFDSANPENNWIRTDYESTGADGRGYGLFWDGDDLYAVFSTDGTQGNSSQDFRRAAADAGQSWLRSYGQGGGAKISVVARLDEASGEMTDAAFLSALLSNGNSNSLAVKDLFVNDDENLVVRADSWFSPRNPNGSRMTQVGSGGSPHDYTVEITPDLSSVVSTAAVGWVS